MSDLNKALLVRYRAIIKGLEHMRSNLRNIVDEISDEGDRAYFGSTNDADLLREIAEFVYSAGFEAIAFPLKSVEALDSWQLADDLIAANRKAAQLESQRYDLLQSLKNLLDTEAANTSRDARYRIAREAVAKAEARTP